MIVCGHPGLRDNHLEILSSPNSLYFALLIPSGFARYCIYDRDFSCTLSFIFFFIFSISFEMSLVLYIFSISKSFIYTFYFIHICFTFIPYVAIKSIIFIFDLCAFTNVIILSISRVS